MANYSIQRSDLATGNITVTEASTNTATNATLIGQNFTGYGDEIATNFLQMLENFATDVDPTTNPRVVGSAIRGQLWYDTTGTGTLKIYNGASFDEIAKISDGTTESSVVRWNNTAGRYQAEERVRVSDAGALIVDAAAAGTNAVTISHDATDLNIAGAGTTDINVTGVTAVNMPSATLVTPLTETSGGTNFNTYATGDVLYASGANTLAKLTAGTNGQVLTMGATVPGWVSAGAGVTDLDSLTDVTAAGVTNAMLYKSAGDWLESNVANLSFDGTNLVAAQYNGIAKINLIDRTSPGTLAATTFSGNITSQANIALGDSDEVQFGAAADATLDFDGTNFNIDASGAALTIYSGAPFFITGDQMWIDNYDGESIRLQSNFTSTSMSTYIGFRDSANSLKASIGIKSNGTNDLMLESPSGANVRMYIAGADKLIASSIIQLYNEGNDVSLSTVAVGTSFKTSRARIYNDINVGSGGYSAGYNETPQAAASAGLSSAGTYNVSIDDIGLLLLRSTTGASTIAFGTMVTVPTGATVLINNDNSGTCTISSPGMTLNWVDGSGGAAPTGNRTLAQNSIATLRKKSGSVWQIWGNGIS